MNSHVVCFLFFNCFRCRVLRFSISRRTEAKMEFLVVEVVVDSDNNNKNRREKKSTPHGHSCSIKKKKKLVPTRACLSLYLLVTSPNPSFFQFSMRLAVAFGRSAAVASSSGASTASPRPMRLSNLWPTTMTTIVVPASAPLSGPARGHCAGASRLGRLKVCYYASRRDRKETRTLNSAGKK